MRHAGGKAPYGKIAAIQTATRTIYMLRFWSERPDLNGRPLPPQGSTLPTAPRPDAENILSD